MIAADPAVAFVAAWIGGFRGTCKQECERWLAVMEDPSWKGRLPEGIRLLALGAALARAAALFDDVGRAARAARRAVELAGPQSSPFWWMAQAAHGHALYLSGRLAEARPPLEEVVARASAAEQPYAVLTGLAVLSLLAGDEGDDQTATSLAARAVTIADAQGVSAEALCGIVHMALGRAMTRQGNHNQAQEQLEWALQLFGIDSMAVHRAHVLLLLAALRHGRRDLPGARALLRRAEELVEQLVDPGVLPALLDQTTQLLNGAAPASGAGWAPPSPSGSSWSCGCWRPGSRPRRSARNSTSRSTLSGPRCEPSTASWPSAAGPRRSSRRVSSACCPGPLTIAVTISPR